MDWATAANVAQVVAAVAQVGATVAAAGGFYYLAKQVRGGNRAEDLKALFDFYERVEKVEARLHLDVHGDERTRIVYELLNFLEVSCQAHLDGLFGKVTSAIVRDKLIDSLSLGYADAEIAGAMMNGVTGPTAFSGIVAFRKQYEREIGAGIEAVLKARTAAFP